MIAKGANIFYYESSPTGSYIAQNGSGTVTSAVSTFEPPRLVYPHAKGNTSVAFTMRMPTGKFWSIRLEAPDGEQLKTGSFTATRWPFQDSDKLGFEWSGYGRGLNTSTSFVEILEIDRNSGGDITSLAINFTQFENTRGADPATLDWETDKASRGSFRYNSDIPIASVPEPTSTALVGLAFVLSTICYRKR